jgi:hypothetical protein
MRGFCSNKYSSKFVLYSEINFKLENDIEWRKELAADKSREPLECKVSPWEQLGFHTYVRRFELIKKVNLI